MTRTAILILKDQSKRNLLELNSRSPYSTVETVDSTNVDKSRIEVQVTVTPEVPAGRLNETVTAKLTDNSYPPSKLRLRGTVIGNVEITPEIIRLTADTSRSAADQAEQSVRVASTRDDIRFELLGVSDPKGQLRLEVDTIAPGEQYTIRARPNAKALAVGRNLAGEVKVLTSDKEQPEVTFRYNIILPRR